MTKPINRSSWRSGTAPLLTRLEAYVRLSDEDRQAVEWISRRRRRDIGARRDLAREGDRVAGMRFILDGWGCRYRMLPDGRRQILAFFLPGDSCDANMWLLQRMDHSIGAITRMQVSEIEREEMEQLVETRPRLREALSWSELVGAAIQREWTVGLGQRTAYERIGHLCVEIYHRMRAAGLSEGNGCPFPITQTDIGEATGLTPVHVNRTLQEIRRDGLITLESRWLEILDLERLSETAMFNPAYLHLDREGSHLDAN